MDFRKFLAKNYVNFRGWKTKRKIVVIESDDWGSIRMPSQQSIDKLKKLNSKVNFNEFALYDGLEKNQDLEYLFETLTSVKDINGNHAIITPCTLVANPDFEAIKKDNFKNYYFETINKTYNSVADSDKVLKLWNDEGIKNNIFYPQLHGREHLNFQLWLDVLNSDNELEKAAFEEKCILGLGNTIPNFKDTGYMAAFDYQNLSQFEKFDGVISDAKYYFNQFFGFDSKSFVAPCSIRSDKLDAILLKNKIMYHQMGFQMSPKSENYKIINRYWGSKNNLGQIYWRRNGSFEPYRNIEINWIDSVLSDAHYAFKFGKPLVLSSHRINFTSRITTNIRDKSLEILKNVLNALIRKYPSIEFLNSSQLGDYIYKN